MVNENTIYFWLGLSGITSKRANALAEKFSPFELWERVGKTLTEKSLFGEKAYDALVRFHSEEFLAQSIDKLDYMGISFITYDKLDRKSTRLNSSHP